MIEQSDLTLGTRVRFEGDKYWWNVQAISKHFTALARQYGGVVYYTVIDWKKGIRGPCNLIGQSYGDGTYTREQCAEMLGEFEEHLRQQIRFKQRIARGEKGPWPSVPELEISHRNRVLLYIKDLKTSK